MSSNNAEESILRVQVDAANAEDTQGDAIRNIQRRGAVYMDERLVAAFFAVMTFGLIVVWVSATSPLVIYGSFAGVILFTLLFGYVRMKRIERIKKERAQMAESWQSENTD